MKTQHVLLILSGVAAAYVALAFRAGPGRLSLLSDPVPEAQAETSGTRLKAKVTTGSDGSKLYEPEVFYDSLLDHDCYFHTAGDGSWRCLPFLETEGAPNAYSDSACQNRVLLLNPPPDGCTPTPPKYTHIGDQPPYCTAWTNDELHIHFFLVGAMINPNNPLYAKSGADCVPANNGVSIGKMVYAIGAEVLPSEFVEGTRGIAP